MYKPLSLTHRMISNGLLGSRTNTNSITVVMDLHVLLSVAFQMCNVIQMPVERHVQTTSNAQTEYPHFNPTLLSDRLRPTHGTLRRKTKPTLLFLD
jgi:hypothetical protein